MPPAFRPLQSISLQADDPADKSRYSSMILDLDEERQLVVTMPMREGIVATWREGTPVYIEITQADGIRRYNTKLRQRVNASPPSMVLDWPVGGDRIQRRENVRVPVSLDARIGKIPDEFEVQFPFVGITADLSAGGCRVDLPVLLEQGSNLLMELSLPDRDPVRCEVEVIRSGVRENAKANPYWAALHFTSLSEADRRDITKFVFAVQLEQRRRGF